MPKQREYVTMKVWKETRQLLRDLAEQDHESLLRTLDSLLRLEKQRREREATERKA